MTSVRLDDHTPSVLTRREAGVPLYHQIKAWILEQIQDGTWMPGERIPTEPELCALFDVSRGTVRQALGELAAEERIYLIHGRGTFVSFPTRKPWSLSSEFSLTDVLRSQGLRHEKRVLSLEVIPAAPPAAAGLRVEPGTSLTFLKRLWIAEGRPLMVTESFMPAKVTSALLGMDLTNLSVYEVLADMGLPIARVERTITARIASKDVTHLLGADEPLATHLIRDVVHTESVSSEESLRLIYAETEVRGEAMVFEMEGRNLA